MQHYPRLRLNKLNKGIQKNDTSLKDFYDSGISLLYIYMLCVLIVEGMSVVVNVMLSLMSVMSPPPALCNLSVRTDVKLCIFGVLALGVSLVS